MRIGRAGKFLRIAEDYEAGKLSIAKTFLILLRDSTDVTILNENAATLSAKNDRIKRFKPDLCKPHNAEIQWLWR